MSNLSNFNNLYANLLRVLTMVNQNRAKWSLFLRGNVWNNDIKFIDKLDRVLFFCRL